MKKESRKLNLNRETILPLQNTQLHDVAGGFTPVSVVSAAVSAASRASSNACIASAAVSLDKTIDIYRTR